MLFYIFDVLTLWRPLKHQSTCKFYAQKEQRESVAG
jgi:hypothetical protein